MFNNKIIFSLILLLSSFGFSQTYTMGGSTGTINTCSGTFVDSGGIGSNYFSSENATITFCPGPQDQIQVFFNNFDTETTHDTLEYWEGTSTSGPADGTYNGNLASFSVLSSTLGTCLTFRFESDGSVTKAGWDATISCISTCVKPTAVMDAPSANICNSSASIPGSLTAAFDASGSTADTGATINTYEWDFGDGTTTTTAIPTTTHTYTSSSRIYEASLTVTDDNGCTSVNSATKQVNFLPAPSFSNTTTTYNVVCGNNVILNGEVSSQTYSTPVNNSVEGAPVALPDIFDSAQFYETNIDLTNAFDDTDVITSSCLPTITFDIEHTYINDLKIELLPPTYDASTNDNAITLFDYDAPSGGGLVKFGDCANPNEATDPVDVEPGCVATYTLIPVGGTPWGTTSNLINLPSGNTGLCSEYIGSCESGNYMDSSVSYASRENLSNLVGESISGVWRLKITDAIEADDGVIAGWSINFPESCYSAVKSITPDLATLNWSSAGAANQPEIVTQSTTSTPVSNPGPDPCSAPTVPISSIDCDGTILTNTTTVGPFNTPGSYTYTLTTTDEFGCEYTQDVTVVASCSCSINLTSGSSNQTICENTNISNIVYSLGGDATDGSVSGLPSGVNGSFSGGIFTISGTPDIGVTGVFNYTVTTIGCSPELTETGTITVTSIITPTFAPVADICRGDILADLPTTSTNGINGTWSPSSNNTLTTTYTFTPDLGQCAENTTLTINVNPKTIPSFSAVDPICEGENLTALPTTSNNGILGTWSPALDNTTTKTYIFTVSPGQCAENGNLTIIVNQKEIPTFDAVATICEDDALSPLPTTSNNGITGSWSPALNNSTTTTYTFTPTSGQCAENGTLTINVNQKETPTFDAVADICSGDSLSALPLVSNNGINGTWSPALNNSTTTTYTFTPTAGQCAENGTLTITVDTKETPTFDAVADICRDEALTALPTTSNNGISGTWLPALNNTTTTTYTFTPDSGQCSENQTLTITVNPKEIPTFDPVAEICRDETLTDLPTTSNNGITGTWSPVLNNSTTTTYVFTPDTGQCAINTTLTIIVNPKEIPTFDAVGPICEDDTISPLPTSSNNGITGTWSPALDNTTTSTYTFTVDTGQCAENTTLTIIVIPKETPTFTAVAAICEDDTLTALPTTSNNGISGSWSPALNNTVTTVYTFTPDASECAEDVTLTITVTPKETPTFTAVAAICNGDTLTALPTTSNNGISGTWSPALDNTETTVYTFTPNAGQCAEDASLTITVNDKVVPTFDTVNAVCTGSTLTALPTSSNNGISGSWSPALNNTVTTVYTFTPDAGECAEDTTLTITVNDKVVPTFDSVNAVCTGSTLTALPTSSNNGISGTWSPALNNTATTVYTFTPDAGECAEDTTLTITITPKETPTFTAVAAICEDDALTALPTTSNNGISGTWSPALNNTVTTVYTFTPDTSECAEDVTLTITVTPKETPTFTAVVAICEGNPLTALPTTSNNGISGTWSPALNNTATTVYTFTPNAGECADDATLTITVNNKVLPTFNAVAAICEDDALTALPTTSNNGISGTWSPALNNTATTIYTFTPGTSECAESASLTITVNNKVVPTFNAVLPICEGGINPLPATSLEGITGTWSPVFDNTIINDTNYTFIPDVNQCIDNTTPNVITVTVNPIITPTFSPVGPICEGDAISLPTVSLEGVLGTWSPAIDDTITTEYTFTPNADQCAPVTTLTIIVYEIPEATIVNGCNNANYTLSTFEPNGDYSYNWYDSAGNLVSEEVSFVITTPDTYELQVSNGTCMVSESINITDIFCTISKGISPNGDGLNDTWDLSNFDIKQVKIFDRYGVEIYSKNNYSNQWDGTSKGNELPSATYYYVITFNNNTTKTGWVYINR